MQFSEVVVNTIFSVSYWVGTAEKIFLWVNWNNNKKKWKVTLIIRNLDYTWNFEYLRQISRPGKFVIINFNIKNSMAWVRERTWPSLWSSSQSSWLQIQRSGFDFRRYRIFWEVVILERSPLSFVSTTEELLGRKSSGFGLESREYGRRDSSRWSRGTLYPQKMPLTSPTTGGFCFGRSTDSLKHKFLLFYSVSRMLLPSFFSVTQHSFFCQESERCQPCHQTFLPWLWSRIPD
jgi:hypothetical protein